MNDQTFRQIQTIELGELLEMAKDDPILAPQLKQRVDDAKRKLGDAERESGSLLPRANIPLPRAAIFLRGGGVQGSEGIRPSLAGEVLIQYEKMYTEQALHDERQAAREAGRERRPRGASKPGLFFTGTPRGSFGLEIVPEPPESCSLLSTHAKSLEHVADDVKRITEADATSIDEAIEQIPPGVLQPLKQFLKVIAQHGAELRLAFQDNPPRTFSVSQVNAASERLERDVEQGTVEFKGVFRGATLETVHFDLRVDEGEVITGYLDDSLNEDDVERIAELTHKRCVARLQATTIKRIGGQTVTKYVLLDARPEPQTPDTKTPVS